MSKGTEIVKLINHNVKECIFNQYKIKYYELKISIMFWLTLGIKTLQD